jgi:ATPase-like protein
MLKKIIMKNFKSYMEKAELDLNATGYEILNETNKDQNDILKGALIVGGNATGKSTVLHSIRLLLSLLVWQVNLRPIDYVCLFKERKGNMQLTYEFLINNENISYLIEGDDKGIYKEKIYIDNVERLNRLKEYAEYTSPMAIKHQLKIFKEIKVQLEKFILTQNL